MVLRVSALCAVGAFLVAGCGGGGEVAGADGADRVPASADLFVAVNTDFESEEWKAASDLVDKFPGGDEAVRQLLGSFEEDDVDFERDVKPALGPEVDIVILDFNASEDPEAVALTEPRDREKFEALMAKGNDPAEVEIDGDWAIVAESQDVIDRFQKAAAEGDSLADSDGFQNAMDGLPEDALAKVYVNAHAVGELASAESQGQTEQLQECAPGGGATAYAAAIQTEQDGIRFEAVAPTEGGEELDTYQADLPGDLPAGALAYVSFNNLADPIRAFVKCAGEQDEIVDRTLAQVELALGVSLEEDVLPLFENEGALVLYRGSQADLLSSGAEINVDLSQYVTASLVLKVEDEGKARTTIDRIAERAQAFAGEQITVRKREIVDVEATELAFGDFSLVYAAFDGKLVVTTTDDGISTLLDEDGEKLEGDEIYEQALESSGAPDETTGFFYANLEAGLDYALTLIQASGETVPPQVRDNLEPLQSFLVHGSFGDGEAKAAGLLRVE